MARTRLAVTEFEEDFNLLHTTVWFGLCACAGMHKNVDFTLTHPNSASETSLA